MELAEVLAALVGQALVREVTEAGQEQELLDLAQALGLKGQVLEDQVQVQVQVAVKELALELAVQAQAVLEQVALGQEAAVAVRVLEAGQFRWKR